MKSLKDEFLEIISAYQGILHKVNYIYFQNISDREDNFQEIIYQLWKSFDSFNQQSSLSTWMYRVAMNVAICHLKVSRRKIATVPMEEQFLQLHETGHHDLEEKIQVLRRHIENLDLLEKGIVMLYLEGKSHEEIAQIVGISTSNVGTKLSRIKEKLKKQIIKIT